VKKHISELHKPPAPANHWTNSTKSHQNATSPHTDMREKYLIYLAAIALLAPTGCHASFGKLNVSGNSGKTARIIHSLEFFIVHSI
jgi:hypothetical protein